MDRQTKIEIIRSLVDLGVPLVRMSSSKVAPTGGDGKWRRVPQEKWKGSLRNDRPAESFHDCELAVQMGHPMRNGWRLYALDVDLKKQEGRDSFTYLKAHYGEEWTKGPRSRTESGGFHFQFAAPADVALPVVLGLMPGIDFLGLGALSFEPPSMFWEGNKACDRYQWELPPTGPESLPELPAWLHSLLKVHVAHAAEQQRRWTEREDAEAAPLQEGPGLAWVSACLDRFTPEGGLTYQDWLRMGAALHESSNGDAAALEVFDSWGARVARECGGSYDSKKTRITWDSFHGASNAGRKVRFGTLVRYLVASASVMALVNAHVCECANWTATWARETSEPSKVVASDDLSDLLAELSAPPSVDLLLELGAAPETLPPPKAQAPAPEAKAVAPVEATPVDGKQQKVEYLEKNALCNAVMWALNEPSIRRNEATGAIEVQTPRGVRALDDAMHADLVLECRDKGRHKNILPLMKEKDVVRAISLIAESNRYHPVRDYLDTAFDRYNRQVVLDQFENGGVTNPRKYRDLLFSHLDWENKAEQEWFQKVVEFWLLGAVCRVMWGYQNPMLILQGEQGKGKSTLAKALAKHIGMAHFYAGTINPQDKDQKIKLASLFIWEADELASTTRGDTDKLKSFLTLGSINERLPYARYATEMRVVCSFVGTTNDTKFLRDGTGSRRFLVAKFEQQDCDAWIQWLWSEEFDPTLLWGEVYAEAKVLGIKVPHLPREMAEEASRRAENSRALGDVEDVLLDYVEEGTAQDFVSRKQVRTIIEEHSRAARGYSAQISEFFSRLTKQPPDKIEGWKRINCVMERGWYFVRLKTNAKPDSAQELADKAKLTAINGGK